MKIVSTIFLTFLSIILYAQEPVLIKNGRSFEPDEVDSFLYDLNKQNDFVVSFCIKYKQDVNMESEYFVLARKDKNLSAYSYLEKSKKLLALDISGEALGLVWDTFIQNELFSMRNENDIPNFCAAKYKIYNSYSYEFVLLSKGIIKKLSYYDPEYYDSVCYGMTERSKIINCVAVISHVLNR